MKALPLVSFILLLLYGSHSFAQTFAGAGGALTPGGTTSGVVTFPVVVSGVAGSVIPGGSVPDVNVPSVLGYNTEITNITLSGVQHTFASDLDLRMISPGGAIYAFNLDNGGSTGLDVTSDMVFDITATDCADTWTSSTSSAQPENGLLFETTENVCGPITATFAFECQMEAGAINGDDVNGTWTLEVTDDAGGDTGSFTGFSITFGSLTPPAVDSSAQPIDPASCAAAPSEPVQVPVGGLPALLALMAGMGLVGGLAARRRRTRQAN